MAADCPRSADLFTELGYEPVVVDIGEFREARGLRHVPVGADERSAVMTVLGVHSEIGRFATRSCIGPGLELTRLTPNNIKDLVRRHHVGEARARGARCVRRRAAREGRDRCTTSASCSRRRSKTPTGAATCSTAVCTPEIVGPELVGPLRRLFDDADGATLAEYLIGGVVKNDLHRRMCTASRGAC